MVINRKLRVVIMVLVLVIVSLCVSQVALADDSGIMPLLSDSERFYFAGWNGDYGSKVFWFNVNHSCTMTQSGNNAYAKNHSVSIYTNPANNEVYPPDIGNGTALFHDVSAYTEYGSKIDSTNVSGPFGAVIDPAGMIIHYRAKSTSSEYLTVPYDMMTYYAQIRASFFIPDSFTPTINNYTECPRLYFY